MNPASFPRFFAITLPPLRKKGSDTHTSAGEAIAGRSGNGYRAGATWTEYTCSISVVASCRGEAHPLMKERCRVGVWSPCSHAGRAPVPRCPHISRFPFPARCAIKETKARLFLDRPLHASANRNMIEQFLNMDDPARALDAGSGGSSRASPPCPWSSGSWRFFPRRSCRSSSGRHAMGPWEPERAHPVRYGVAVQEGGF
jgi:hypothetical protein